MFLGDYEVCFWSCIWTQTFLLLCKTEQNKNTSPELEHRFTLWAPGMVSEYIVYCGAPGGVTSMLAWKSGRWMRGGLPSWGCNDSHYEIYHNRGPWLLWLYIKLVIKHIEVFVEFYHSHHGKTHCFCVLKCNIMYIQWLQVYLTNSFYSLSYALDLYEFLKKILCPSKEWRFS